jgi:NADH dehydrogenase FAD-containing subunit
MRRLKLWLTIWTAGVAVSRFMRELSENSSAVGFGAVGTALLQD